MIQMGMKFVNWAPTKHSVGNIGLCIEKRSMPVDVKKIIEDLLVVSSDNNEYPQTIGKKTLKSKEDSSTSANDHKSEMTT